MRILALSAVALAVVSTPAVAQDAAPTFTGVKVIATVAADRISAGGESKTGVGYGGSVGYDIQSGSLIIGGEVEGTGSTAKSCDSGFCIRPGRDLYVGGRLGTALGDKAIVYVKAGYTNARAKLTTGGTTIDKVDLDGGRVGVGIEGGIGTNGVVRLEYRYSNYESDFSRNQVALSAGIRF